MSFSHDVNTFTESLHDVGIYVVRGYHRRKLILAFASDKSSRHRSEHVAFESNSTPKVWIVRGHG